MSPSKRKQDARRRLIVRKLRSSMTTAEMIAERVGVSVRTIYRDIDALRSQGLPIIGEAGMGYVLRQREVRHG